MLRIPPQIQVPEQTEDEFLCLNLDVTTPEAANQLPPETLLPVLIWIHGMSSILCLMLIGVRSDAA
jgi:carboxylesterase type B